MPVPRDYRLSSAVSDRRDYCDTSGAIVIRDELSSWVGDYESTLIAHNWVRNELNFLIGGMHTLPKRFSNIFCWLKILRRRYSLDGKGRFLWTHTRQRGKSRLCRMPVKQSDMQHYAFLVELKESFG